MKSRQQLETAMNFINELLYETACQESKGNFSEQANEPLLHLLEKRCSLILLKKLLDDTVSQLSEKKSSDQFKPLQNFLAERWERIRGTDLSYNYSSRDNMSAACIAIAQAISTELNKSIYELLMPTLELDAVDVYELKAVQQVLVDKDLQLHQFVLSDDDKRIITILPCLNSAVVDGEIKHTTLFNDQPKLLSESEKSRVVHHSPFANQYFNANATIVKIKTRGDSPGAHLNKLIIALRRGGVYQKEKATVRELKENSNHEFKIEEKNSGADANEGILEFNEFLKALPAKEQEELLALRTSNYHLGDLWSRLSTPNVVNLDDTIYCVELIANDLERILNAHKDKLYNNKLLGSYEKRVEEYRDLLAKQLNTVNYVVTPHHHKDGDLRLLKQLLELKLPQKKVLLEQLTIALNNSHAKKFSELKPRIGSVEEFVFVLNNLDESKIKDLIAAFKLDYLYSNLVRNKDHLKYLCSQTDVKKLAAIQDIIDYCAKEILLEAAKRNDLSTIKFLLQDLGTTLSYYQTRKSIIKQAIENQQLEMLCFLLQIDFQLAINKKWNIAHILAFNNQDDFNSPVLFGLENSLDIDGNTPLHIAIEKDNETMVKSLCEQKALTTVCNKEDLTPIHLAIIKSNKAVITELLRQKVNLNAANKKGVTPFQLIVESQKFDLVAQIFNLNYEQMIKDKFSIAHCFAYSPLQSYASYFTISNGYASYFNISNAKDLAEILKLYCNDFTGKDMLGRTAVQLAVVNGNLAFLEAALRINPQLLNQEDNQGRNLAFLAAEHGHLTILEWLHNSGININKKSNDGVAPVDVASKKGYMDIYYFYARHNPEMKNSLEATAIHSFELALERKDYANAATLLGSKSPNNDPKKTLAHILAETGRCEFTPSLVKFGFDLNADQYIAGTPAHIAVNKNDLKTVAALLKYNCQFNKLNKVGFSPIHTIQTAEMARLCSEYKVDFSQPGRDGNTLAHLAVMRKNEALIKELVKLKVNFFIKNNDNKTALDVAKQNNLSSEIVDLISKSEPSQNSYAFFQPSVNGSVSMLQHSILNFGK